MPSIPSIPDSSTRSSASVSVWFIAARPKTLPAALAPVAVGTALSFADGVLRPLPAVAAAVCALLLQIGSNLANDYFDFVKGADTADRLGPIRATAAGYLSPQTMRLGMLAVFCAAAVVGFYLVLVGGLPILAVGAAAILAALTYTGGPIPFGYYGLGDLAVFFFFGIVGVSGTYYVQALSLPPRALFFSIPVGALITAILVVNNLRDIDTDRRAAKRTLAVALGRAGARIEYLFLLLAAYLVPLLAWSVGGYSIAILLAFLSLPLAARLARQVFAAVDGPTLNRTLAGTARLSLIYSLLLSIGLLF